MGSQVSDGGPRILRLTQEAYDQEALLSYEDLAVLLTTSPATVKRDIRALKQSGYFVMTRGAKHDMGPGLSHKTQILELSFKAYTFTESESRVNSVIIGNRSSLLHL